MLRLLRGDHHHGSLSTHDPLPVVIQTQPGLVKFSSIYADEVPGFLNHSYSIIIQKNNLSFRISAFHVLRPRNRNDDVVLALTTTGTVKVWTLSGDEHAQSSEPILENESKQVELLNHF